MYKLVSYFKTNLSVNLESDERARGLIVQVNKWTGQQYPTSGAIVKILVARQSNWIYLDSLMVSTSSR